VLLNKRGRPTVHIEDVKLLRPGTNTVLPVVSRSPVGPFDIAAGDAESSCYFLLPKAEVPSKNDVLDVYVRRAGGALREKATWTAQNIVLPAGLTLVDIREQDASQQAGPSSAGKHAKKDGKDV
jgi:hypothetical protein